MKWIPMFVLLFTAGQMVAQEYGISWGEEIKIGKNESNFRIIGSDKENFYTIKDIRGKKKSVRIEVYNAKTLNRSRFIDLDLPTIEGQNPELTEVFHLRGRWVFILTGFNKSIGANAAYAFIMDDLDGQASSPIILDSVKGFGRVRDTNFGFRISNDSTKVLVYHDTPYEKKSNESFSLKVYNTDLTLLWQKRLELPYDKGTFEINDYIVDNKGDVYMVSGISTDKSAPAKNWKSARRKRYVLVSYSWQNNKVKEYDVNLKDKWIISLTTGVDPNNNLVIGGFYSNDQYFTIAGTFFFAIDGETKTIKKKGLMPFSEGFLKQFMSEKRAGKGQELSDFYFDHFVLAEDGSALIVAEQYYVTERVSTDFTTGRTVVTYVYNFDDIIVVKMNADGVMEWAQKIAKRQNTASDKGAHSSYALARVGEKLHFIFNDHPDNIKLIKENKQSELRSYNNIKKSVAALATIDVDGFIRREALFDSKDGATILKPKVFYQPDAHSIILFAQYKKRYKFGRVDFR